jgi:anti-anti-sigma factor
MNVTFVCDDGEVVQLDCGGEISQVGFQVGENPVATALPPGGFSRKVLLNLARANYIDSSGVSWLIVCHRQFEQAGGTLVLYAVPPQVAQVLQLLRLSTILNIAADEAAARALARGGKS